MHTLCVGHTQRASCDDGGAGPNARVNGMNGDDGPDGYNGADGYNGPGGYDGPDGYNGPDGFNGADGYNGRNGSSPCSCVWRAENGFDGFATVIAVTCAAFAAALFAAAAANVQPEP